MQRLHLTLGLQGRGLRRDHIQIAHRARFIAVGGQGLCMPGGIGRGLFVEVFLLQVAQLLAGSFGQLVTAITDGNTPQAGHAVENLVAFAESRIRRETIAAEDILHDLGAFSMISSDSQAMGRVGEVITRTWQTAEIADIVEAYRTGAENAKAAGFDGVEIHGANGYLLDQFLQSSTNKRTDQYGGSVENRARLLLEVTDAAIEVWGAGRVGVHLSPRADLHDMGDENLAETFGYVARELGKRGIAYICAREHEAADSLGPQLKQAFGGAYIVNESFTKDSANAWLAAGKADAVAFGVPFIANPDLPARLKADAPLNEAHPESFYSKGPVGYIDYPAL